MDITHRSLRTWLVTDSPQSRLQAKMGSWYGIVAALIRNPLALAGFAMIVALILVALFAPLLETASPIAINLSSRLLAPNAEHWLGTDELGRDIYSRIIAGSRITLLIVGLVAVTVVPVGLLVGTVSGYVGGVVDSVLMRITDIFMAFPRLVLALAFVAVLKPGLVNAVVAISLTSWPAYARIARVETMTIRKSEFVMAAELQGASRLRILWRHMTPLCLSSVIVRLTLDMAGVIIIAAGLGFLGLGAQPPTPEWGAMVATGRQFLLDQWWVSTIPGAAIFFASLAFNLAGDGLRDVLDPRNA
jgi:peptide/nickel transport system permease protein